MTPERILVAIDFSDASRKALTYAAGLRRRIGCALEVVYVVYDPFQELDHLPAEVYGSAVDRDTIDEVRLRAIAEAEVGGALGSTDGVGIHVVHGHPAEKILEVAQEAGADMICLGPTGKGGVQRLLLGSVSQEILRSSPVPVLSVV